MSGSSAAVESDAPADRSARLGSVLLQVWCAVAFFLGLAGVAWVHAFGAVTAGVMVGVTGLTSFVIWCVRRPRIRWGVFAWATAALLVWALASALWSAWPTATLLLAGLLWFTTFQGLFFAGMLDWPQLLRALSAALQGVLALSLAFELWVSLVVRAPLFPGFEVREDPGEWPIGYWVRDGLLDGERIQGIMGSANLLGIAALLALVVFGVQFVAGRRVRWWLPPWILLAGYLFVRAESATAIIAAVVVVAVLLAAVCVRVARRPWLRWTIGAVLAAGGVVAAAVLWAQRDVLIAGLDRDVTLSGRFEIWDAVLSRAVERPVVGWGFATPWPPWEPAFDGWIIDQGQTALQAHSVWLDLFLQLGAVGVLLAVAVYGVLAVGAWRHALSAPRAALGMLPLLLVTVLLVQGVVESTPLLLGGWVITIALGVKLDQRADAPRPQPAYSSPTGTATGSTFPG